MTKLYLPYAIYGDFAFFFEPIMIGYIFYIIFVYNDWVTLFSAMVVVTFYISMNIIAEDTLTLRQKLYYLATTPAMYFFLYILSYVEYVALIKSLIKIHTLKKSLDEKRCGWQHVERMTNPHGMSTA